MMEIFKYIILGIIQGITEPLPISSSGHLLVFRNLFNTNMFNDLNFEIIVNFASFLAILFIFRQDIINLIKGFFGYLFGKEDKKKNYKNAFKYCMLIVVSTIPTGIIGLLFKDKIENVLSTPKIVGLAFLITALVLRFGLTGIFPSGFPSFFTSFFTTERFLKLFSRFPFTNSSFFFSITSLLFLRINFRIHA